MKVTRRFTKPGQDALLSVEYEKRTSRITNPDGSVVFEMHDAEIPKSWSQLATDIMVSKYFRKAGVPQIGEDGKPLRDASGNPVTGPEKSVKQVVHRLAGCWRHWAEKHGYFDTADDAQAFYDELAYMLLHQMCAPNSPQWFNTGLNFAYGITGPSQGHYYCDPKTGETLKAKDAYTHSQPHACQPYHAPISTPQGPIAIGDIVAKKLVGLEVFDGRNNGTGRTKVVAVKSNGEKPVFRIVLKNGASVEATADHLVCAMDERKAAGEWRRVDALTPGMRMQLATQTSITKGSAERDVLEAALAGWLQGDGFVGQYTEGTNRSLTLEFMTIDDDEFAFVMERVQKIFEGVHYHVRSVESQDAELDIRRIRLYGEPLRPFVEKYSLLREGSELSVPAAIRSAGMEAQAAYLRALFQADGTVRLRSRATCTSDVVLTTTSATLASGVQSLLLNMGIYARVQRGVETRSNRRVPLFVSIGYAEARAKFRDLIGFVSEDKRSKLDRACSAEFAGKQLPPLREEVIIRIESVGTQPVYDIQTESGQYLSNNVIVHNCFIQSVSDDLVNSGGIMDLWTREARLFKYGSGTGSNFSKLRGENEPLSGGGKSSGLMSFLRIGDRAAGAIKSGGTTRRAAKMVCLDLDHPDIEAFVNWKVREELKVSAMAEGIKRLPKDQQELAKKLGLKLDYDFNGEGYQTVSGQNSNNSVRIPNRFFKAVEEGGNWNLTWRTNGKVGKSLKAAELWEQIAFAAWRCADPGVQFDDTINQWHTCGHSGRINASNPCVTGDTRVLTPGGIWRRIDQMIHLPSRVVTNLDGQEIHATEGAFPTGTKDVFELRTVGGYTLKLTADHKVYTRNRGWVQARDLNTSDEVKLPSQPACVEAIGEPRDARFFQVLGLFLSAANADTTGVHLDRFGLPAEQVDDLAHYVADHWGQQSPYDDDYVDDNMVSAGGGTLTLNLTHRRLIGRLGAFIRTAPGSRRLSDEAFTAGLAAQKHILRGLFTADGVVRNNAIELPSDNRSLLEDIQLMLLGFGVQSSLIHCGCPVTVHARQPEQADAPARHGLRITSSNLRAFAKHIGLVPGRKADVLAEAVKHGRSDEATKRRSDEGKGTQDSALRTQHSNWDSVACLIPLGKRQVFDLTEPETSSFIANGITVHNCSEYMFLDDTACNLASLNVLTFFDPEHRSFDIESYKHAIRLWTIVLETSVLMASFPSEEVATLSYKFRTLGLGYANLGAMLMQAGIPYDSEKGRAICAALTAILTGESYAASAEMAKELGTFPGYEENKADMLRVMRNHRRAAYNIDHNPHAARSLGHFEGLEIHPVGLDAGQFSDADPLAGKAMLSAARECWDRALALGEKHGYRNAQATVIAPTGTIGLLMDCDTTGVEPDFALVKFKKLAGGGYFKIANQSVRFALANLGYSPQQIQEILQYVMGTLSLESSPHINRTSLLAAGLVDAEIEKIEESLPGVFELGFAFSPWSIGAQTLKRLNIAETEWQTPGFSLLKRMGFSKKQIDEANDIICGRGCIEGAPHLKAEHLPVFDTANACGKYGTRFIHVHGHIRMMAAAQPFISGAISKTINLPNEANVEDIKNAYHLSWKLGLKANALYRDGSKLSQPLNVKSDDDLDKKTDEDDEENVTAAREEVAKDVAAAAKVVTQHSGLSTQDSPRSDNLAPAPPIEKIIERIVERPLRRRLPDTRRAMTHKFDVSGHEGYITVGLYDDGAPGEVFITMAKEGSTIGGLMDTVATLVSLALQYGVPVESLVKKFEHVRFEPSGMTRNSEIPFAKSLVDYIFRWLAMEFVPGYRAQNAPKRPEKKPNPSPAAAVAPVVKEAPAAAVQTEARRHEGTEARSGTQDSGLSTQDSSTPFRRPQAGKSNGNGGNGHKHEEHSAGLELRPKITTTDSATPQVRLVVAPDPVSQQSSEMQADAPACDVCGSITVRSGTCYKCLNCGNSMGCS